MDAYVQSSPQSTFYHQSAWKDVVEKTYNHKPVYLTASDKGITKGVLPLFIMRSSLFKTKVVSVPFAPYGGICSDDPEAVSALLRKARDVCINSGADFLELRNLHNVPSDLLTVDTYSTSMLSLESDPESLWGHFSRKVRNSTRKAMKSGIDIASGKEYLRDFYNVYSLNIRNLGTPVHDKRFF